MEMPISVGTRGLFLIFVATDGQALEVADS